MSKITVISKLTHVERVTDGSQVTLNDSSIVKIDAERADILGYERSGNDLIVKLADGETLTLKNFFVAGEQGISQLVLATASRLSQKMGASKAFCQQFYGETQDAAEESL